MFMFQMVRSQSHQQREESQSDNASQVRRGLLKSCDTICQLPATTVEVVDKSGQMAKSTLDPNLSKRPYQG